jgi:hypothetical protein
VRLRARRARSGSLVLPRSGGVAGLRAVPDGVFVDGIGAGVARAAAPGAPAQKVAISRTPL